MLQPMIDASKPDELMIIGAIYDHEARKKSYSLLADAFGLAKQGGGLIAFHVVHAAVQRAATRYGAVDPGPCR